MSRLVAFFVDRSLLVNLIMVFVCVFGVVVATITTRALLPDERPRAVLVFAELPGASAVDIERFVTFRLEEALQGMEGIERITSTTVNGRTELAIRVKPDVPSLTKTMEQTRSRLAATRHLLPKDLRPLTIKEEGRKSNQWLMNLLIENVDTANPTHRRAIQAFADRLRRIPNVVEVSSNLPKMDLYVRFSRASLEQTGINVTTARQRLYQFLSHAAIGAIRVRDQDVAIAFAEPFESLEALKQMPLIVNRVGEKTILKDVAQVAYGFEEEQERLKLDGRRFVDMKVVNSLGADSIEISQQVHRVLSEEAKKLLPEPITVRVGRDASNLIAHEMETLQGNGLGGILLVLIILTIFLGWRVSAMTALGLPFCYLAIVLVLHAFDINFNIISLVAMILVVGILVDDAIIVSEEFCQRLALGESSREAAINAVRRVAKPVAGMVATTTVAFLPLLLIKGEESWIIRPLPIVIIAALLLSLFESFFLLPNHLRHLIPAQNRFKERRFVQVLREAYGRLLAVVLRLRYVATLVVLLLIALAVYLVTGPVKFESGLNINGQATIYVELTEPATSLDDLAQKLKPVELLVEGLEDNLVDHYKTLLGKAYVQGNQVRGWKYAIVAIIPPGVFVEQEEKRFIVEDRLRAALKTLEETERFARLRFTNDPTSDTREVVTVYVSGGDRIDFTEIQEEVRKTVSSVENVEDVFMDQSRFQRAFHFVADDAQVLAYGLTRERLQAQLREHFARREILRIRERGEERNVYLGFQEKVPPDGKQLAQLTVMTDRGVAVPIHFLGRWQEQEVLRRIEHRDTLRMFQIDVRYDVKKVDAEQVADAIEGKLTPLRQKYPSYHISVKPSEAAEKTKSWVIQLVIVCVGLIYLFLALSLNSLSQPIVVIFAIPFGFVGVVLAFYLHGMNLGIMASIGILGLAGVVVNDSLVMASTINDAAKEEGLPIPDAVLLGAKRRFRAVLLTSLTTLAGVFPLAYGLAGRPGWIQPMVLAVGWGLLFATLISLFFIPCLLLILNDLHRLGAFADKLIRRK